MVCCTEKCTHGPFVHSLLYKHEVKQGTHLCSPDRCTGVHFSFFLHANNADESISGKILAFYSLLNIDFDLSLCCCVK